MSFTLNFKAPPDGSEHEQGKFSPEASLSSLGTGAFKEQLSRLPIEQSRSEDKRQERQRYGHVRFELAKKVPDVGGLGWRTKSGHLLKNQSYFSQLSINKWDNPAHSGPKTWQEYHGPKMRTDADTMAKLDHFDALQDEWNAKKTYVNTTRVETLDRFYNQKVNHSMLSVSSEWAPHHRARREVHSIFETFDSGLDEKPVKELKKVLVPHVLKKDREAIRAISKRIQQEETWKMVYKRMEKERHDDVCADRQHRMAFNDRLMMLAGQPVRQADPLREIPNNCTERSQVLAEPHVVPAPRDVTTRIEFRGLIHADNEHALETLFPGYGHELSTEFRARATKSTEPGWPPPPRPATPQKHRGPSRESRMMQGATLTRASIPVSERKIVSVAERLDDEAFLDQSQAQFLKTVAPPPPRQHKLTIHEDISPKTATQRSQFIGTSSMSMANFGMGDQSPSSMTVKSFLTGTQKGTLARKQSMIDLAPPVRPMVYPVLVASPAPSTMGSPSAPASPKGSIPRATRFEETIDVERAHLMRSGMSAPSLLLPIASLSQQTEGLTGKQLRKRREEVEALTGALCLELENFEVGAERERIPCISNFFSTPRSKGTGVCRRMPLARVSSRDRLPESPQSKPKSPLRSLAGSKSGFL